MSVTTPSDSLSIVVDPGGIFGIRQGINLRMAVSGGSPLEPLGIGASVDRTANNRLTTGGFQFLRDFRWSSFLNYKDTMKFAALLQWNENAKSRLEPFEVVVYNLVQPFSEIGTGRTRYRVPGTTNIIQEDLGDQTLWIYWVAQQGNLLASYQQLAEDMFRIDCEFTEGDILSIAAESVGRPPADPPDLGLGDDGDDDDGGSTIIASNILLQTSVATVDPVVMVDVGPFNRIIGQEDSDVGEWSTTDTALPGSIAVFYDGQNDWAEIDVTTSLLLTGDFTIEMFFRNTEANEVSMPLTNGPDTADRNDAEVGWWAIENNAANGQIIFHYDGIENGNSIASASGAAPDLQWNYVKVFRENGTIRMQVNSTLQSESVNFSGVLGNASQELRIGSLENLFELEGYIDENLRIVNVALTDTAVPTVPFPNSYPLS